MKSRRYFEVLRPAKDASPERVPSATRGASRTGPSLFPSAYLSVQPRTSAPLRIPRLAPFLCSPRNSYTAEHPTKDASPERPPQGGSRRNPPHDSSHTSAYNDPRPPRNSYTRKDFKSFRFSTCKHFLIMLKTKDFKPFRISRSTIFARNPFGFSTYIKTWGEGGYLPSYPPDGPFSAGGSLLIRRGERAESGERREVRPGSIPPMPACW